MDEVNEGVDEVKEPPQDVTDAQGASQAAQPGEQSIPPGLSSLTDLLHLQRKNYPKLRGKERKKETMQTRRMQASQHFSLDSSTLSTT